MSESSAIKHGVRIDIQVEDGEATATDLNTGKVVSGTVSCREAEDGSLVVAVGAVWESEVGERRSAFHVVDGGSKENPHS